MSPRQRCIFAGISTLFSLLLRLDCGESISVDLNTTYNAVIELNLMMLTSHIDYVSPQKTPCSLELTCKKACHQRRTITKLFCQCDTLCWFYGDCCADYYTSCLGVDLAAPALNILEVILSQMKSYDEFLRFYEALRWRRLSSCQKVNDNNLQMVRTCSRDPKVQSKFERLHQKLNHETNESEFVGISSKDIVDQCENLALNDTAPTLPASLKGDFTIHFYNVFCALCNGVHPRALEMWKVSIEQKKESAQATKLRKENISIFSSLSWRWCTQYEDQMMNREEKAVNQTAQRESGSLQKDLMNSLGTTHSNDTTCKPKTLSDIILCQRYKRPYVTNEDGIILKNLHCTLCNEETGIISCSTRHCMCPDVYSVYANWEVKPTFEPDVINLPNFQFLFYFRDPTITKIVEEQMNFIETKDCPANQVFAPFYGKCVDVVGAKGEGINLLRGQRFVTRTFVSEEEDEEYMPFPLGSKTVSLAFIFQPVIDGSVGNMSPEVKSQTNEYVSLKDVIESALQTGEAVHPRTLVNGIYSMSDASSAHVDTVIEHFSSKCDLEINTEEIEKSYFLAMRSIWKTQISRDGALNYTEMFSHLLTSMHNIIDNMSVSEDWKYFFQIERSCLLETRQRSDTRSKLCVTVTFTLNDTKDTDKLITRAEEELVRKVIESAHTHNFLLQNVSVHNLELTNTIAYGENVKIPVELCTNGRRPESRSVNVTVTDNGTYTVHFEEDTLQFPLNRFGFSFNFFLEEITQEVHLFKTADITVCVINISLSNCSTVFYNTSNILLYHDHLIITKLVEQLVLFLERLKANNTKVVDLLQIFSETYNTSSLEVYQQGTYVVTPSGVFVCSDYSNRYTTTNVSLVSYIYNLIPPKSLPEKIASVMASSVSIICLLMVLAVYILVKELRNIPGQIVMSLSAAMLLAQILFLCSVYPQGVVCQIYAAVQHGVLLSSFAWLAAMAVHLAFTLCRPSNSESRFTFNTLSALCWGMPCLLACSCFTLDKVGIVDMKYGDNGQCWFGNTLAKVIAFGIPLFLLVSTAIISAIFILHAIQKSSVFVKKVAHGSHRARSQLLLCVNLSILMGFNWVVYLIAVAVESSALWTLFILTNGSQGLFVFTCFIAKKSVIRKLTQKCPLCNYCADSKWGSTWTNTNK